MSHPGLIERDLKRLRREVSDKGSELNEKLTKLLAGQDIELADLSGLSIPTEDLDKIAKLRHYLHEVSEVLRSFLRDEYGRCRSCSKWIDVVDLNATPWRAICVQCEAENGN